MAPRRGWRCLTLNTLARVNGTALTFSFSPLLALGGMVSLK
jgi:hypothetical protein